MIFAFPPCTVAKYVALVGTASENRRTLDEANMYEVTRCKGNLVPFVSGRALYWKCSQCGREA